jgi:hypothetical protein
MDFSNFWWQSTGGPAPHQIGNSLRFRGAQHLSRTPGTAGNRQTWTLSVWIKQGNFAGSQNVFSAGSSNFDVFNASNSSRSNHATWVNADSASGWGYTDTAAAFRDPGAWSHYVIVLDSPAAAADRSIIYVNGVRQPLAAGPTVPLNGASFTNSTTAHNIGRLTATGSNYFDGYMSEIHFVDGTALDPTTFGEFNADGVWVPKEVSGVTYGVNGFYLPFDDPANIGRDASGNGNDWTPTGFELMDTTSTSYDWVADSPTDNYSTLNPLDKRLSYALSNANLRVTGASSGGSKKSTFTLDSGRWYFEGTVVTVGNGAGVGLLGLNANTDTWPGIVDGLVYVSSGIENHNGTETSYGATFTSGDVIGVAFDCDSDVVTFFKNGVSQGAINGKLPATCCPCFSDGSNATTAVGEMNYGNRPFIHTPPAGFEPLSTANQPNVAITNPSDHFDTILDTGANILTAAQAKFPNGLWWIKDRQNSNQHQLVDSVRGGNLAFQSPGPTWPALMPEVSYAAPTGNSVAWCWAVPAGTSTNNDGTIQTTVAVNQDAGFVIGTYTGNGQTNQSIGHGLDQPPEFVITKNRNGSQRDGFFVVRHESLGTYSNLQLSTANGQTAPNAWYQGGIGPITTADTIDFVTGTNAGGTGGGVGNINYSGSNYSFYAWHSIPGYSFFGSYLGNGSTDGPFVYTGFRPAFVMIKNATQATEWHIFDSQRNPYNLTNAGLYPSTSGPEVIQTNNTIDILSNGFKCRTSGASTNGSGNTLIYIAFAEFPLGGGNVSPSPAR